MIVIVLILSKEFPQSVILSKSKKHNILIKSSNGQICFMDFLESRKVHLHALIDQNVCKGCHKTAKAKRKDMCVSCYISKKIRVGRSLLIFFFSLILPRNTTNVLFA